MGMPVPSRRRHARIDLTGRPGFRIEFSSPADGGTFLDLPLQDVSLAGVSFALDGTLPGLELGSAIGNVTIHLGDTHVKGEIVVCHVTARRGLPPVCGTLFYPRTDKDLHDLKAKVIELDAC